MEREHDKTFDRDYEATLRRTRYEARSYLLTCFHLSAVMSLKQLTGMFYDLQWELPFVQGSECLDVLEYHTNNLHQVDWSFFCFNN